MIIAPPPTIFGGREGFKESKKFKKKSTSQKNTQE